MLPQLRAMLPGWTLDLSTDPWDWCPPVGERIGVFFDLEKRHISTVLYSAEALRGETIEPKRIGCAFVFPVSACPDEVFTYIAGLSDDLNEAAGTVSLDLVEPVFTDQYGAVARLASLMHEPWESQGLYPVPAEEWLSGTEPDGLVSADSTDEQLESLARDLEVDALDEWEEPFIGFKLVGTLEVLQGMRATLAQKEQSSMKYKLYIDERCPFYTLEESPKAGADLPAEFIAKYNRVMKDFEDLQEELERMESLKDHIAKD